MERENEREREKFFLLPLAVAAATKTLRNLSRSSFNIDHAFSFSSFYTPGPYTQRAISTAKAERESI